MINTQKTVQVHYTIQDSEYEHRISFQMPTYGGNEKEQAFMKLAAFFASNDQEKQAIMEALRTNGQAAIGPRTIKDITIEDPATVTVYVRGGVIQDIQNIPEGIRIRVQDYDIDNLTEEELLKETEPDEEGGRCVVSIWEKE